MINFWNWRCFRSNFINRIDANYICELGTSRGSYIVYNGHMSNVIYYWKQNNISIIFSFLTVIGVIILTIFFILIALGVIEIRTSAFSEPEIATIIFPFILAFTVGSATLTYLTSTVSDTNTIKTLRNLVAGLSVGIAVMTLIMGFIGILALQLLPIVTIAEIVLAVIILFLIVLDKQESLETISVLTIRCRELQQQTAKLEQDLNAQTGKEQTSQEELEQLKKVIRSLKQMLITIINCIQKPNKKPCTVSNN